MDVTAALFIFLTIFSISFAEDTTTVPITTPAEDTATIPITTSTVPYEDSTLLAIQIVEFCFYSNLHSFY